MFLKEFWIDDRKIKGTSDKLYYKVCDWKKQAECYTCTLLAYWLVYVWEEGYWIQISQHTGKDVGTERTIGILTIKYNEFYVFC